jgi:hypothetical protein
MAASLALRRERRAVRNFFRFGYVGLH